MPSPRKRLRWLHLTVGLCVLPLAGGSGIHRPVGKKATPGAEYKAKVRAVRGDKGSSGRVSGKGRKLCPSLSWRGTFVKPD